MNITVEQMWEGIDLQLEKGSGANRSSSATVYYLVSGTVDDIEAISAAYSMAAENVSGIPKSGVSISERLSEDLWKIEVEYSYSNSGSSSKEDDKEDEATLSFDCGGGSKKVITAIGEQRAYGKKSVDPGSYIGWNGKTGPESEIAGVEIPTAQLRETYTKTMSMRSLSTKFKRNVASLVGKVNSSAFKGWEKGEVMFLGCSFSGADDADNVSVTFNFSIQPNEEVALSSITGDSSDSGTVAKKGFEYVWSIAETKKDDTSNKPKISTKGVWVAQVAEYADFSKLGL